MGNIFEIAAGVAIGVLAASLILRVAGAWRWRMTQPRRELLAQAEAMLAQIKARRAGKEKNDAPVE